MKHYDIAVIGTGPAGQKGAIQPIPVFKPYESFTYAAQSLRAPFEMDAVELPGDPAGFIGVDGDIRLRPLVCPVASACKTAYCFAFEAQDRVLKDVIL